MDKVTKRLIEIEKKLSDFTPEQFERLYDEAKQAGWITDENDKVLNIKMSVRQPSDDPEIQQVIVESFWDYF